MDGGDEEEVEGLEGAWIHKGRRLIGAWEAALYLAFGKGLVLGMGMYIEIASEKINARFGPLKTGL